MIPRSIRLSGFLCYKDEQHVAFDAPTTLWMLSGLNGSGKSAIFDAVTFALFGQHRGGGQQHLELINKDSKALMVEFDFALDGCAYRARRTQTRDNRGGSRGTQQMFRQEASGDWVALEDTNLKRGFDLWVEQNIGLTYETFTSSVLLLQGKAESLLSSKPEDRRRVLAQIVDLERYERLHKAADDERKVQEAQLKELSNRLKALPSVTPLELAAAEQRIVEAEEARSRSRAEVERWQGLEHQARAWAELQLHLGQARNRCRSAQALLDDSAAIEAAAARLRELREVLPWLQTIAEGQSATRQATQKVEEFAKLRQKHKEVLAAKEDALKQARDKRQATQARIAAEDARLQEVSARHRRSTERMTKLREYELQENELARLHDELKRLPTDPAACLRSARERCEALTLLSQVAPLLARFAARRDDLRRALEQQQALHQTQQVVRARGERCKADVAELRPRLEEAERRLLAANDQAAEFRTRWQQAQASLAELSQLDGAKLCRHCGQALTASHLDEETKRRRAVAVVAEERRGMAVEEQKAAKALQQPLQEQLAASERSYQEARLEYRDCLNQEKQATQEIERLQRECAEAYGDLPDSFRRRVTATPPADWWTTTYPDAAEVQAVRAEANQLPAARTEQRQADDVQRQWQSLKALEAKCQQMMGRLEADLPSDRQQVRREHESAQNDEQTIKKTLEARRAELRENEGDQERLSRAVDQVRAALSDVDGQVRDQELTRQHAQHAAQKATKQLPPSWQNANEQVGLRQLSEWQAEKAKLDAERAEERDDALRQARQRLADLKQEAGALEARQEAFPDEARQPPEQIKGRLHAARQTDKSCDDELIQARQQKAHLEERKRERDQVGEEYLSAEQTLTSQKLLAELLGRDRLQLYLVRQAERQVVEYANAVLDRLSGGLLYLRLSGAAEGEGGSSKALELEAYNRATGEKPINVAFLSGSQKFRVAVSLALGIGQYASRQHRPIESVIIDEGFGCLDRQGRQVMIQELQNLRGQMRCILLVSHQEEFADAFNDGYHFALENGATRVARIQR